MCGIFGAVSLTGMPLRHPEGVAAMAAALAHRGPDGERIVGHERARLGARRLAIMDLTAGDQPFQSPDSAVWAALRDTCAQPTVFVFRANDRDRRAAMTDLPLLYEDGRYAAYGPCRSIPGRG